MGERKSLSGCDDQARSDLAVDRKTYIRDVYPRSWITTREKVYGFLRYDKNLCSYICQHVPKGARLLDVAMGTGYPFGDFFQKAGYSVYGIDISPRLIERCQQLYPDINSKVGDAEEMDYPDSYFDCTYCFHSTWYFPNLNKVIDEMLRVTCPGGLVIFDIQNRNNQEIDRAYRKRLSESIGMRRIIRYAKNVATAVVNRSIPAWHAIWHTNVYETPTYPESIYKHLEERGISDFQVMTVKENESIETTSELGSFRDFGRLGFVLRK